MARRLVDLDRRPVVGHACLSGLDMARTAMGLGRSGVDLAGRVLGTRRLSVVAEERREISRSRHLGLSIENNI
jgi:hypothetical protein